MILVGNKSVLMSLDDNWDDERTSSANISDGYMERQTMFLVATKTHIMTLTDTTDK